MPRIFISCVTAEFGAYRVEIAKYVRRRCEVNSQEDFRQVAAGTIQKLDEYIRSCDAVIHILGEGSGAMADPIEVMDYLDHEPKFMKAMKALGDFSTLQLSYTQWEAFLAAYYEKPLFVYRAMVPIRDGHPTQAFGFVEDSPVFEPQPNDADLVRQHCERLEQLSTRRFQSPFKDLRDLCGQFISDLHEILGTKAQVSIKRHERFGRHKVEELRHLLRTKGEPLLKEGFFLAAFVQLTGKLPDVEDRNKNRALDFKLVDTVAEYESPYELLGLVMACQTRSEEMGLGELTSSLKSWFGNAIKEFNKTQKAGTKKLTEMAVAWHCTEAFHYLKPDSFPMPSLELAWRVAPADPQKRVFAEGYLRWGRHHSKVSLKADTSIPANEVPTRFMECVWESGEYMAWLIERLDVFVSESELHHPWEYQAGCNPDDEDALISWPIVLRLLRRSTVSGGVMPPPTLINRQDFACRLGQCDTFLADVRARGGFFAMPLESEDGAQVIQRAASRASIGIWLRQAKPIEVAEDCFNELDGQSPASVPRWVFEKKRDSPKSSPWRDVAVLYDHPEWPGFEFSSDQYDTDDQMRTNEALSGI